MQSLRTVLKRLELQTVSRTVLKFIRLFMNTAPGSSSRFFGILGSTFLSQHAHTHTYKFKELGASLPH